MALETQDGDRVKAAANIEVVRRLMIKYFVEKGFDKSFDRHVSPLELQDMVDRIPALADKVELVPHAVEVNAETGTCVLGWNLFVLGNSRMYVGEIAYDDVKELSRQVRAWQWDYKLTSTGSARRCSTPYRIINFIIRIMSGREGGLVNLNVKRRMPFANRFASRHAMPGMPINVGGMAGSNL